MEEGMEIPIGGDLGALEAAFDGVIAAIDRLGDRLEASLNRSVAATQAAAGAMAGYQGRMNAAAASANAAGAATATTGQRLLSLVTTAGAVGSSIFGVVAGFQALNTISKVVTGTNLAATFGAWLRSAGGVRGAFAQVGTKLRELASNPTFRKIAIGAVAATAVIGGTVIAVKALRKGFGLITSITSKVFHGIVAGARAAGSAIGGMFSKLTGIGSGGFLSKLLGPFTSLAGVIGAGGLVYLAVSQFKDALSDAAAFEQMEVSISQFVGSAEKAKAILEDAAQFGVKTPFELPELTGSLNQLLAAGIGDEAVKINKELAAISKNGETLGDLGDAMAKGFAKGRFQTEELNKFLERGINLKPQLEALSGASGKAFDKAIEAGLTFDVVRQSIANMSKEGGQFFGMLERQSATFVGRVSNLSDAWGALRRNFAQPIMEALKPILMDATGILEDMVGAAKRVGDSLGTGILSVFALIKNGQTMEFLQAGLNFAFQKAMDILTRGFRGAVAFLAAALPPIFQSAMAKLSDPQFWEGIGRFLRGAAAAFNAEVRAGLGQNDLAKSLNRQSEADMKLGQMLMSGSGNVDFTDTLKNALIAAASAASEAAGGPESPALTAARDQVDKLFASVAGTVEKLRQSAIVPPTNPVSKKSDDGSDEKPAMRFESASIAGSMTRFGGGGFGVLISQAMVTQQQQANRHLAKIVSNTSNRATPVAAWG
jgi:hypothetical protein